MGNSISPSRREQVIGFDSRTSGMSVEEFCAQVGISRASFYRIRRRAEHEGLAAALTAVTDGFARWGKSLCRKRTPKRAAL